MLYIVFYICLNLLLSSCATVIAPSGGDKDVLPPEILYAHPKNKSINFEENEILISFNEYVQIKNSSQINFFPEIKPKPLIKVKGKTIVINLQDSLKLNTTYTLNFNNSIVDINESNPLRNFQYVFSTGSIIDTCKLNGFVFDLKSNSKIVESKIGLFKNELALNFDSLIRHSSPDYFVLSDENGNYSFSNLQVGNYILYAFKDFNLSKSYEEKEPVSMPIKIQIDNNQVVNIPLFIENRFIKKDTLECDYKIKKKDSLGIGAVNLKFKKEIYDYGKYVGELILNDSSVFCFHINSGNIKVDSLHVGAYAFRMFEDINSNNVWDSGNIKTLTKPESIKFFGEKINVKKDWEIDVYIE